MIDLQFAGKALIYIGVDGVACCSREGRPPCRPLPLREGSTGVIRSLSLPDCYVIPKLPAVDTEVDPPQPIFPANDDETFKNRIRILPAGPEAY
jgi:hypothetical protein